MPRLPKYLIRPLVVTVASLSLCYVLIIQYTFRDKNLEIQVSKNFTRILPLVQLSADWRNLTKSELDKMSVLGKWLLESDGNIKPEKKFPPGTEREYLILVWKHGKFLERRHMRHFTDKTYSPWDDCSVKNCRLSYDSSDSNKSDAILIHLHKTTGVDDLPKNVEFKKRMSQRWVFLTDESPLHTFLNSKEKLSNYNGLFNWSMTYRMDSDVPVPYGRTVQTNGDPEEFRADDLLRVKKKLVAVMGSNCGNSVNNRWEYVRKLKESLGDKLDIYGKCLNGDTNSCPGHFTRDCPALDAYKFYLAFENSNCEEYLTEKPFWHGYKKHSIPVIMGATRDNCRKLLPPNSFIHVDDFANPTTLADYLVYLDNDHAEYLNFHAWRGALKVLNEHGYFQSTSYHYCRLCEALNYNDPSPKVYNNLDLFWSAEKDCRQN